MTNEALLHEVRDETTAPERLRAIFDSAPNAPVLRALAKNPNTSTDILWALAEKFPREVLDNPILPLLYLEDSNVGLTIDEGPALGLLSLDDLPTWMLEAFAHGRLSRSERVRSALEAHWQRDGQVGPNWRSSVYKGLTKAIFDEVNALVRNARSVASEPFESALRSGQVPDWLAAALNDALRRSLPASTGPGSAVPGPVQGQGGGLGALLARIGVKRKVPSSEMPDANNRLLASDTLHALKLLRESRYGARSAAGSSSAPNLSEADLEKLASSGNTARNRLTLFRVAMARDDRASADTLLRLAELEGRPVRVVVARHPNAPHSLLQLLADDEDAWVRGALARNERLSPELLTKLAGDAHCIVRANVARHPQTPVPVLALLARDDDGEVLDAIRHRRDLPAELTELAARRRATVATWGSSRPSVQMARDPQTPAAVLERLALDSESGDVIRQRVAANRRTPASALVRLSTDANWQVRAAAAANPATPAETLRRFVSDTFKVRKQLAANPQAPLDVLLQLMAEDKPLPDSLHYALATNAGLPSPAVEELWSQVTEQLKHDTELQLWAVVSLAGVPGHIHARRYPHYFQPNHDPLFAAFVAHPNATLALRRSVKQLRRIDTLLNLATSDTIYERLAALACPEAPVEFLEANLHAPNWWCRLAIARNEAATPAMLQILARDGNRFVRSWAGVRVKYRTAGADLVLPTDYERDRDSKRTGGEEGWAHGI